MTANSNLAKNLKFLMNKHGLTANGLQGKTGITQSTTSRILNGNTKNPRDNLLQQYVDFFGVDLSDLRYKDLAKTQETSNKPTPDLKSNISIDFMAVDDWDDDTPLDDEVAVPFYKDFSFACGQGKEGITMTSEWRKLRISRATIDRIGAYKDRIFATLADGNSMSPTINDGDTIWVDMSKESIKDGHIFVFEYGGLFMCKRLYRLPNGGLRVVSDNSDEYGEFEITGQERQDNEFKLIGWVWNIQRMLVW